MDSDTNIVVTKSKRFQTQIQTAKEVDFSELPINRFSVYNILTGKDLFQTSQVLIRKSFLVSSRNSFDEFLDRNQETEFFIRLILNGAVIKRNSDSVVYLRSHDASITGVYCFSSEEQKLKMNLPAYIKIYSSCKKEYVLDSALQQLFNDFFFRCLRKIKATKFELVQLFISGCYYGWFP
jgi:hypothetical protein